MPTLFFVLESLLFGVALLLLVPGAFFLVEVLAARQIVTPPQPTPAPAPRTAILIPAHNEANGIVATLDAVCAEKAPGISVLVVADNCTDATAEIARHYDTVVIERHDTAHIGKGYTLAFGIAHLKQNPPEVVLVLDADCVPAPGTIALLAQRAVVTGRPVQGAVRWRSPAAASPLLALSNFAFLVKNVVRSSGLQRLHAPCLLNGTGMAFPWTVLADTSLATGHLTEDLWLSVELTCRGHAPLFCPEAVVYGDPPQRTGAVIAQRTRWEQGHLAMIVSGLPKLVLAATHQRRAEPLWLALELSVPPLALLALGVTCFFGLSLVAFLLGTSIRLPVLGLVVLALPLTAVTVAWWKFGRAELEARTFLAAPAYVLWKIPLYLHTLLGRRTPWTRTEREPAPIPAEGKQ